MPIDYKGIADRLRPRFGGPEPRRDLAVSRSAYRTVGDRPTYEELTTFHPGPGTERFQGMMVERPTGLVPRAEPSFTIDRFEGDWAVVEMDDGSGIKDMPRSQLPEDAREGDVIRGGQIDVEETQRRLDRDQRLRPPVWPDMKWAE